MQLGEIVTFGGLFMNMIYYYCNHSYMNATDFRYNRITDKNVVYLHDKAISNILIFLQVCV